MRTAPIELAEKSEVLQRVLPAVSPGLLVGCRAIHLVDSGDFMFSRVKAAFHQGLAVQVNNSLDLLAGGQKQAGAQMKTVAPGPNCAFRRQHRGRINRRMRFLQGLREKRIIVKPPESPLIGKWPVRSPCLDDD